MNRTRSRELGSHDPQQHVRYVEVYTIDDPEVEDQPVQVKALRWEGDSYEVYGDAFRVGGTALAGEVAAEERFWITWRRDAQRWERLTAGSGQAFQVIRGVTTAAVAPTDVAFQIESVAAYEQNALAPSEPTWIAAPAGGVTLAEADAVWAIYRFNQLTFDPGGGDVQVDWLMFEPGSSNTPPLREFELTATKTLAQSSATVKWLDLDGNLTGGDTTIYDPDQRFSGRAANYVGSERGFRGQALLRTDLAAEDPDRWEIVTMESFAEWAVVEKYAAGIWVLSTAGFGGGEWDFRRPNADGGQLGIIDPGEILPATVASGTKAIARLALPDTSPPTYAIHSLRGGSGSGGAITTVYIDHDIPKAVQQGSSFQPGITTVEKYEFNEANGRYERGAAIEIENHDSADGLEVSTGQPYRGFCTQNEYGKHVLHVVLCRPIPDFSSS